MRGSATLDKWNARAITNRPTARIRATDRRVKIAVLCRLHDRSRPDFEAGNLIHSITPTARELAPKFRMPAVELPRGNSKSAPAGESTFAKNFRERLPLAPTTRPRLAPAHRSCPLSERIQNRWRQTPSRGCFGSTLSQELASRLPIHAGIGNGNAVLKLTEIRFQRLSSPAQIAFEHRSD